MKHITSLLVFLFSLALLLFASVITLQAQALRYFEFDFRFPYPDSLNVFASTSDSAVLAAIDAQLALPDSLRSQHINGPITHGTGDNNVLYSWHFVPSAWSLADFSIEVCDGRPLEDVEADTAYWIGTLGQYCPWGSFVKREVLPNAIPTPQAPGQALQLLHTWGASTLILRNLGHMRAVQVQGLYDLQGRMCVALDAAVSAGGSLTVDVAALPSGVYLLRYEVPGAGPGGLRFVK